MIAIREAAVAGQFYPQRAGELRTTVAQLLDRVAASEGPPPKALIVPHAGFVYSGPVAATAYASLRAQRRRYRRVVLIGPSHHGVLRGLALSSADAFRTPLGDVPLDTLAPASLDLVGVDVVDTAHRFEHCLEVHLPFLQAMLDQFSLVPIVVGNAPDELVARTLDRLWGGPETLIVISSDLSHYLRYDAARALDAMTCEAIEQLDRQRIDHAAACGAVPIRGLLETAGRRGMRVTTLDLRSSGDTSGDRRSVVGYGSWLLAEGDPVSGV